MAAATPPIIAAHSTSPFSIIDSNGQPNNGLLPTDRPNVFKGYAYYEIPWLRKFSTNFGIFQYLYQGSPVSSYVDEGTHLLLTSALMVWPTRKAVHSRPTSCPGASSCLSRRTQNGAITVGTPYYRRTPWFIQSDLSLQQTYKISENKAVSFPMTVPNALNQHATTAYWQSIDSD